VQNAKENPIVPEGEDKHVKGKENVEISNDLDSIKLDEEENGEKYTLETDDQNETKVPNWPKYENPSKQKSEIEKELA
jgi:hypothetical protein